MNYIDDPWLAGNAYRNLSEASRNFIDDAIRTKAVKIPVVKFLRSELGVSLTIAKGLYESRERFLTILKSEFGAGFA